MSKKASNKKPTSTNKNKKTSSKKNNNTKEYSEVQDEVIIIGVLLISILLFLSNFNLSGKIGSYINNFIFGMIGVEAYILPFALFFITVFYISNAGNKIVGRKIMAMLVFLISLTALIQLISMPYNKELNIFDYYVNSATLKSGGGIIGGIQVMIYCMLFDKIATYVILITIMIVSIVVISGKALFTYISRYVKENIKENIKEKNQEDYHKEPRSRNQKKNNNLRVIDHEIERRPAKFFDLTNFNDNEHVDNKKRKNNKIKSDKNKDITQSGKELNEIVKKELSKVNVNQEKEDKINKTIDNQEEIQIQNYYSEETKPDDKLIDNLETGPNNLIKENKQSEDTAIDIKTELPKKEYLFPPLSLLNVPKNKGKGMSDSDLKATAYKLQSTLESFGVNVNITNISCGPAVTRYEIQPEQGVKVSRITGLADDIKLNLAAADIRIEAPIPGKAAVGIEVPNSENSMVNFRELVDSQEFINHSSDIAFAVGKDIGGQNVVTDIGKMPHLLIAGATGSGKSVCINTIIMSLIYKSDPTDVRLIMIDPKVVELSVYNGIPHLLIPVVTDPKKASAALAWAVAEMTDRYQKFADLSVRDLKGYNEKIKTNEYKDNENLKRLPQIVIIIDELADLMMVAPGEVEDSICRLAQMARAAGLHLIIATQRPSVNVITGLIKANVPSRIAFAVSSAIDSRTILDGAGAEKLLGKGDMLFFPAGYPKPVRVQGAFISDKEVSSVVEFLKENNKEAKYNEEVNEQIINSQVSLANSTDVERDEYFIEAAKFIIEKDKASIGMLQRVYRIGFNRAARMMDQLSDAGIVGPDEGTKPRQVLMDFEQFDNWLEEGNM